MRRRRVVQDDFLDSFVEQRGVQREDSHFAFAVKRNGGRGKFLIVSRPIQCAQNVPDLHRRDGATCPDGGALDIGVLGGGHRLLGESRIQNQHVPMPQQRQQFVHVRRVE